ncbi:hypothetical protein CEXT_770251 [Caerostris extrusa]|uniref:Uncharacterized protein n=1 Tax=Caerostris extrusa TaxID=172846 RepID=A0AAV4P560_CAEEX|nr:hypothetical protein CEXT_770251 [Caerostris extrusa]
MWMSVFEERFLEACIMRWRLKDRLAASESSVVQAEDVMPASFGHPSWCPHLHSIHETSDRRLLFVQESDWGK